ncbi:MAG TPA: hypothetical protein VFU45_03120, partial [Gemmatimonadales bacterium]|nr:hypothetical protein [Gemmatimonadales bacterium]
VTLSTFGLPTRAPAGLAAPAVRSAMATDKKNRRAELRFALVESVGRAHRVGERWTIAVAPARVEEALAAIL